MAYDSKRPGAMLQSAGTVPLVASIDAVAVFDPADGRVVHIHHAITFEGAERLRDREAHQQAALQAARTMGQSTEGLNVLYVADFQPSDHAYRVDVERRQLVGEPATRPGIEGSTD